MIEGKLKESAFIDQSMVVGEQEKYPAVLISPDFSTLASWCKSKGLDFKNHSEMIALPDVKGIFKEEINRLNKMLNHHEKIGKYKLVPHVWGPDTGELSPTLKLKRKVIFRKYQDDISDIFMRRGI